jgi:dihydroflavonol-4-reductase
MIDQARTGKLKLRLFPETGLMFAHVEDIATGIVLAHDKGQVGESYVLSGERGTMGSLVDRVARLSGRKPPRLTMPTPLMKLSAPLGPVVGPLMGFPPNLREMIKLSDRATYWARDDKARRELGFAPRGLDEGLRETLAAQERAAA